MKNLLLILISILALSLVACNAPGEEPAAVENGEAEIATAVPATQDQIVNIIWQWSDLTETEPAAQSVVPNPANYTLTLSPDGNANVMADCNSINWSYTMAGNKITFDTLFAGTLAACAPDSMDQAFLQNLGKAESAVLDNGRLILNLNDGGQMGFVNGGAASAETSSPENSANQPTLETSVPNFVGQTVAWEKFQDTAEENDITVPNPENYTVTFNPDGTANIKADCNQLSWTYELTNEGTITFNTLGATTLAMCPEGSLDQQFLQLLGSSASYVEADGKLVLNLQADAGNMVFRYANAEAETAVTGTITTAEPTTIPEDAIIQIQIQNSSLADAPAEVLGEQILEAAGVQFPIYYKVAYNPDDVDDRFNYTMSVRITNSNGKLIFISDTVTSVITNGYPTSDVNINVVPVVPIELPEVSEPAITITSPQPGETLDGPYIASGTGVGLPEGNVVVKLLDGNGELMAEQATVLQGEDVGTGGSGTWQVQFDDIYGQPQSNGTIEASNPETGVSTSVSIMFSGQ